MAALCHLELLLIGSRCCDDHVINSYFVIAFSLGNIVAMKCTFEGLKEELFAVKLLNRLTAADFNSNLRSVVALGDDCFKIINIDRWQVI